MLHLLHSTYIGHFHAQMLFGLCQELHYYTLGANYQPFASCAVQDYPQYLQLGYGLLHTEAGEYRPATAANSPTYRIFHMGI